MARNVHFISGLIETKVDFAVAHMPNTGRFHLHIYAALAEQEAAKISQRTEAALEADKARGTVLGMHGDTGTHEPERSPGAPGAPCQLPIGHVRR